MPDEMTMDDILAVLENPTRRMILRELAREPRYSLQLAQMLNVSQQAIMKHLRLMEGMAMVEPRTERSDSGGPPRKMYAASQRFSVTIDMGPGLFEEVVRTFEESDDEAPSLAGQEPRRRLADVLGRLGEINEEMIELDDQRTALIEEKERLMRTAYGIAEEVCDDPDAKRVLRHIVEGGARDVDGIAEALNMRERAVRLSLARLEELGLYEGEGGEPVDAKKAKGRRK
jgi:predicted transcriptional regulator